MRLRERSLSHRSLLGSAVASGAAFVLLSAACIPDPEGDFNAYLERTASLNQQPSTADASIDSKPPTEAVEQLYVGICVSELAVRDPAQALRFYTETKFVPDPAGAKLTISITPLRGWDTVKKKYVTPETAAAAEKRGDLYSAESAVDASGRYTARFPQVRLVPEANSVSGRPSLLTNVTLDGRFTQDVFCANLSAFLAEPYEANLAADKNTCLFTRIKDGDPMPKLVSADFVCPLN